MKSFRFPKCNKKRYNWSFLKCFIVIARLATMTDSLWDVSRAQRGHVTPVTSTADYQQHLCFSTRGNRQRMQALLYQRRDKRSFPLSNYIRQTLRLPNSPSSTPENWGRIIYSYSTPNSDFLILFSFPNCELCWLEQRWRRVWVFKEQLTESWSVWRRAELVFMVGFIHFIHDNLSMLPCMSRNTIPLTADIANLLLCMCHIPSPWPIQIFVVSWLISSMWKTPDALTAWLLITSQMNKCGQFSSYLCWILIQQVCRNHLQCITFEGEPSNCFDENNNFSSLHTGGEGVCCLVKEQC